MPMAAIMVVQLGCVAQRMEHQPLASASTIAATIAAAPAIASQ